jgi:hypothetical protein
VSDGAVHVFAEQRPQIHGMIRVGVLKRRVAMKVKHRRKAAAIIRHLRSHSKALCVLKFRRESQKCSQMRTIDIAAGPFEQPRTARDQLREAGIVGRCAFHAGDRLL